MRSGSGSRVPCVASLLMVILRESRGRAKGGLRHVHMRLDAAGGQTIGICLISYQEIPYTLGHARRLAWRRHSSSLTLLTRAAMQPRSSYRFLSRVDAWANRVYTSRWNPLYHSGAIAIAMLLVLIATGIYLLLFYRIGAPYESVGRIHGQVWTGRWIRGLHRFASDAAVVAAVVHAFRMYAQRRTWGPRALAWVSGVVLLLVILA